MKQEQLKILMNKKVIGWLLVALILLPVLVFYWAKWTWMGNHHDAPNFQDVQSVFHGLSVEPIGEMESGFLQKQRQYGYLVGERQEQFIAVFPGDFHVNPNAKPAVQFLKIAPGTPLQPEDEAQFPAIRQFYEEQGMNNVEVLSKHQVTVLRNGEETATKSPFYKVVYRHQGDEYLTFFASVHHMINTFTTGAERLRDF